MRWICLAALLLASSLALAEEPEGTRTRFYNFDDLTLTGDRVKPQVLYTDAAERARFERLFALKRSLLPELRRTARGGAVFTPRGLP